MLPKKPQLLNEAHKSGRSPLALQNTRLFPNSVMAATVVAGRLGMVKPIEDILGTYAQKGLSSERLNIHQLRKSKTYLVKDAKQKKLPLCVKK